MPRGVRPQAGQRVVSSPDPGARPTMRLSRPSPALAKPWPRHPARGRLRPRFGRGTPFAPLSRVVFPGRPSSKECRAMRSPRWIVFLSLTALGLLVLAAAGPAEAKAGPDPKEWDRVVDKAIAYLKTTQDADGSWNGKKSPGITGIALTGMLQTGKVTSKDPSAEKALKFIRSLINDKAGHIAGKDPRVQLQNYVTCVNVMALMAADRDSYKTVVGNATKFLKRLQWDEGEDRTPDSDFYGA